MSMMCLSCRIQGRTTDVLYGCRICLIHPATRTFVTRLMNVYHNLLSTLIFPLTCLFNFEASSQHPFPNFGLQAPPAFIDPFFQIAGQVAVDHKLNIGVHVCDLEYALKESLMIRRCRDILYSERHLRDCCRRSTMPHGNFCWHWHT